MKSLYRLHCVIALPILLLTSTGARADVTYCYQGNNFNQDITGPYTTSGTVSGCVTLSAALPFNSTLTYYYPTEAAPVVGSPEVVNAQLSDSVNSLGMTLSAGLFFGFGTTDGEITTWYVNLYNNPANPEYSDDISTTNAPGNPQFNAPSQVIDAAEFNSGIAAEGGGVASTVSDPGTWKIQGSTAPTVPEQGPISLSLTILTAVGLIVAKGIRLHRT